MKRIGTTITALAIGLAAVLADARTPAFAGTPTCQSGTPTVCNIEQECTSWEFSCSLLLGTCSFKCATLTTRTYYWDSVAAIPESTEEEPDGTVTPQ